MVKIAKKSAVQMFNICSYLASDMIPINMFIRGKDALPGALKHDITDDLERDDTIKELTKYSLLSCEKEKELLCEEKRVLYMHRLLQEVVQIYSGIDCDWLAHCLDFTYNVINWQKHVKGSMYTLRQEVPHVIAVAEKASVFFDGDDKKIEKIMRIFFSTSIFCGELSYLNLSISCIDKYIVMMERVYSEKRPAFNNYFLANNLFMAYNNRGVAYNSMAAYNKAITSFDKAIRLGKNLRNKNELHSESELATAYMNRGISYNKLKNHDKALLDNTISVEIYERLCSKDNFDNKGDLASCYINRGAIYEPMMKYDEAVVCFNKGIYILEGMKNKGKAIDESDLARAYKNRGVAGSKTMSRKNEEHFSKEGHMIYHRNTTQALVKYRKKQLGGGDN